MNKYLEKIAMRKLPDEEDLKTLYGHYNNAKTIHSEIKKRSKQGHVKKAAGQDFIKMDTPLFIRVLEKAREDLKTDEDLHRMVEKILKAQNNKEKTLTMDDYDSF